MTSPLRIAAMDLLTRGGCSSWMLAGEFVTRQLFPAGTTLRDVRIAAADTLTAMANEGVCQKWPTRDCYTLPSSTPVEDKPTDHHPKRRSALECK